MKIMTDDGDAMVMIKCLDLEKKKKKKQKAQGKDINSRSHFVSVIKTLTFRLHSRTIKRGETHIEMRLSKCH